MRPVVRGEHPADKNGNAIVFRKYTDARGPLISRLGEYCSYCEMHSDADLAVEHVLPKQPAGSSDIDENRLLDWDNFLLSCRNCNSTKLRKDVGRDDCFWPDRDNTFRALVYSEEGIVSPANDENLYAKASKLISLLGLDKTPDVSSDASDRRWMNRREAWNMAVECRNILQSQDTPQTRELVVTNAQSKGYWSIWMTVFKDDPDMCRRLIEAFPGTCSECFDPDDDYKPVARPGGQC